MSNGFTHGVNGNVARSSNWLPLEGPAQLPERGHCYTPRMPPSLETLHAHYEAARRFGERAETFAFLAGQELLRKRCNMKPDEWR